MHIAGFDCTIIHKSQLYIFHVFKAYFTDETIYIYTAKCWHIIRK